MGSPVAADAYHRIGFADRPGAATPEPGWWSQCTHPRCAGHWRTGLETRERAERAYARHECPREAT